MAKLFVQWCTDTTCNIWGPIPPHGALIVAGQELGVVHSKEEARALVDRSTALPADRADSYARIDRLHPLSETFSFPEHLKKAGFPSSAIEMMQSPLAVDTSLEVSKLRNELAAKVNRPAALEVFAGSRGTVGVLSDCFGGVHPFLTVKQGELRIACAVEEGRIGDDEKGLFAQLYRQSFRTIQFDHPSFIAVRGEIYGKLSQFGILSVPSTEKQYVFFSREDALQAFAKMKVNAPQVLNEIRDAVLPGRKVVEVARHMLSDGWTGEVHYVGGLELGRKVVK